MEPYYSGTRTTLHLGDCVDVMRSMPECSVDAIVTDPPYGLEFMGKEWDKLGDTGRGVRVAEERHEEMTPRGRGHEGSKGPYLAARVDSLRAAGKPAQEWHFKWATEALRVLKPGGHLLAFGGTRTYHRLACAIEDAGFEIRDSICWLYGSGFPKSLNVSKAIDTASGAEREIVGRRTDRAATPKMDIRGGRYIGGENGAIDCSAITAPATDAAKQWDGWGTALKPANEPIVVARKPLVGTVAENVQEHGTGAMNIEACRIGDTKGWPASESEFRGWEKNGESIPTEPRGLGRWPANVIHDGSDEVLAAFPDAPGQLADLSYTAPSTPFKNCYGKMNREGEPSADKRYTDEGATNFSATPGQRRFDTGSAARFFYCAKASSAERGSFNNHPTVKPVELMRYLCRLVTPPDGLVLDPFTGSGTTLVAAREEGFRALGIEREEAYCKIIVKRLQQEVLF